MKHIHALLLTMSLLLFASAFQQLRAQGCTNPSISLPDENQPVVNPSVSYCTEFTIDPSITGNPLGLSMNITHTWQGDLSIRITACGNTLMVMTRPGGGQCGAGCPCGSDANMGGTYTFADGGGPNPDLGVAVGGGAYGVSTDPCGAGTVSSFAELLAGCPSAGTYTFTVCITDHANNDTGIATNVTPIFATNPVCGCTDPAASNYNPSATVDDGSCLYCNFVADANAIQPTCGLNNGSISVTPTGPGYTYSWSPAVSGGSSASGLAPGTYTITVLNGGCSSVTTVTLNPSPAVMVTATPTNATCGANNGSIFVTPNGPGYTYAWSPPSANGSNPTNLGPGNYTVTVTAPGGCTGTATATVLQTPPPVPVISGPLSFCVGSATILNAGSGFSTYSWSNLETTQQIVVSSPGVYSVTVTNAAGCTGVASVNVTQTPEPMPVINGNLNYCDGGFTVLSVGGGYSSYLWTPGNVNSPNITISSPGTYTINVTAGGCPGSASVTVNEVPAPLPTISGTTTFCAGSSTTLMVNETFSSYAWSPGGGTGQSRVVNAPGTYTVTVTNAQGCTGTASVTVTQVQPPVPVITGPLSFCPGGGTVLNAGNGFSSYQWSGGGGTAQTMVVSAPGLYMVTVTNASGCTGTASAVVTLNSVPMPNITGNTSICAGQSTTLSTGTFAAYEWSNNTFNQSTSISTPGTVSVTVTNAAGCEGTASVNVTQPASPTPVINGNNSICVGESTTLNAGSGYTSYLWAPGGSTAQQITVSTGGTYTVTVTNAAGCQGTASFVVAQASSLTPVINGNLNFCPGETTALTVAGSYSTYSWSPGGSTSATINAGAAGTYTVTVTSAGGCTGSASVNVVQSPVPTPAITGDLDYCAGLSTQLDAGTGYSSYLWNDGSTTQLDTISTPGVHSVVVTNSFGCEGSASATVVQNANPTPSISGLTAICPSGGSTTLSVAGGPYTTYQWSSSQTTPSITASSTGPVAVTVTDGNGCIGSTQTQITALVPPMPTISGPSAICTGTTGTLTASGGFSNYSWSTSSATQSTTVSGAGDYTVTVTDGNGCTGSATFSVAVNPLPTVAISGDVDFCAGESSQLDAGAGYSSYLWSNGPGSQFSTVAASGDFSVTVTDANGCANSASVTITEFPLPHAQIAGSLSFCTDGFTTLSAGSFASYLWSGGETTSSVTVNTPGDISLMVTDANGCSDSETVTVQELTELTPAVTGELAFCEGGSTTLDAGVGYVSYLWSDGSSNPQLAVDSSGTYSVLVADASGCMGETSVVVVENALPQPAITGDATFCEGATSILSATPGFSMYQWTGGADTENLTVSSGGNYQLTVTDANGCQNTAAFVIQEILLPTPEISGIPGFCPGAATTLTATAGYQAYDWSTSEDTQAIQAGTTGTFGVTVTDNFGCVGSTSIQVSEYVTAIPAISGILDFCPGAGTSLNASGAFVSYSWTGGAQTQTLAVIQPGVYAVTATDANGCQTNASVTTTEFVVTPPTISGIAEFCTGSMTSLTAQPGYATYQWTGGTSGSILNVTQGGAYTVSVTDSNGCPSNTSITVAENPLPVASISGDLDYCFGTSTTLDAGGPFAGYSWTGGLTTQTLTVTAPGPYTLTVTNNFGCRSTATVSVVENPLPQPQILGTAAFCDGETSVLSANATYAGYLWSDNSSGASITASASGNYGLTVTDNNGCVNNTSLVVTEHPLPQFNILGDLDFCDGQSSTLSISNPYAAYVWSNQSGAATLPVNSSGNYSVTVTDANGCQSSNTVAVVEYPLPQVNITGTLYFCEGSSTTLSAPAGLASYAWTGGQSGANLTVTAPGSYSVTATDSNGCSSNAAASVIEAAVPVAVIAPVDELDCALREVTLISNGSSQGAGFQYVWSGPDVQANEVNNPNVAAGIAGAYTLTVSDLIYQCPTATATITVVDLAYEPAVSLLVSDVLDCVTPSVQLNGAGSQSGPGILYRWYDASGNLLSSSASQNNYPVNQPGAYTLEVFDQLTSCVSTISATVTSDFNYPVANAGPPRHLDCRQRTDALDGTASSLGSEFSYSWSATNGGSITQGQTTPTPTVNAPGNYNLVVTDTGNGCTASATVQVTQNIQAPVANAGQDQTLNCVVSAVTLDGSASTAVQPLYRWVAVGTTDTVAITPLLDLGAPGNYVLWVIDNQNGCADSDVANALMNDTRVQGFSVNSDQPTCFGDTDGSLVVHSVEGGTPPFVYSLNGAAFSAQSVFNNLGSGEYNIVIQDAMGCEYQQDAFIEVSNDLRVDAGPDQYIDWGDTIRIAAQINVPEDELTSLKWQSFGDLPCANCTELTLGPLETTAYSIAISDENGCVAKDQVTIFVRHNRDVFIPNAFSPDNDGTNDVLMIFAGRQVVRIKSFGVFNRWGEAVFEVFNFPPNDPLYGWNGTGRGGQIFNAAVFVYLAEVEFIDGSTQIYKGDVSLIR